MPKAKNAPNAGADPDKLIRQTAGSYRTADERFEVRDGGVGWYLVDLQRTNELGQELLHGPFDTLKDARAEIPEARKVVPIKRVRTQSSRAKKPEPPANPRPPETWIDRLPSSEQADVRRLIQAVERQGIANADDVVKRARSSAEPVLANVLIEHKLNALIDAGDESGRSERRRIVRAVLAILADEGRLTRAPLPRWELSESSYDGEEARRVRPSV